MYLNGLDFILYFAGFWAICGLIFYRAEPQRENEQRSGSQSHGEAVRK